LKTRYASTHFPACVDIARQMYCFSVVFWYTPISGVMNGGTTSFAPGTTFGNVIARSTACRGPRSVRITAAVESRLRPNARRGPA
jgi:hypothetical protein